MKYSDTTIICHLKFSQLKFLKYLLLSYGQKQCFPIWHHHLIQCTQFHAQIIFHGDMLT